MKFFNTTYISFVITTIIMNCIEYIIRLDDIKYYGEEEYVENVTPKYLIYDGSTFL